MIELSNVLMETARRQLPYAFLTLYANEYVPRP